VLLGLKNGNSKGASASIIIGKEEFRGERKRDSVKCYNRYLYLLPADLGGATLLGLLGGVNNYEKE
jgi:hypothetical protein